MVIEHNGDDIKLSAIKTVANHQATLSFGQTKPPAAKKTKTEVVLSTKKTEPPAAKKKKTEKTVFAL